MSTWEPLEGGGDGFLFDVCGWPGGDIVAVGERGVLFSRDGGDTWQIQDTGNKSSMSACWGTGLDNLWVMGRGRTMCILHFDGKKWRKQKSPTPRAYPKAIDGTAPDVIYAVGSEGILVTRNAGKLWELCCEGDFNDLYAPRTGEIYAVGGSDRLVHSTDGGRTWALQHPGTEGEIRNIWGDKDELYLCSHGNHGTLYTRGPDGWVKGPRLGLLRGGCCAWADDLLCVAENGGVHHRVGSGEFSKVDFGWTNTAIAHIGDDVFVIGGNGRILRQRGEPGSGRAPRPLDAATPRAKKARRPKAPKPPKKPKPDKLREQLEATDPKYSFASLKMKGVSSLDALADFPRFTDLTFEGSPPDLTPLRSRKNLKRLTLQGKKLDSAVLAPLAGHPALTDLSLPKEIIGSLEILAELPALHRLGIEKGLEGLRGVALPSLCWLHITHKSPDLTAIAHLAGLTGLTLSSSTSLALEDLSPISGLTALENLTARSAKISDLRPLSGMASLKRLELQSNKTLKSLDGLQGLSALEDLTVNLCPIADLSPLEGLENLQAVRARGSKVKSMAPLLRCAKLRMLYLEKSKLQSIDGIGSLTDLATLSIWGTKVRDLSPLDGLSALGDLNIADLGSPTGTDAVKTLSALTTLDVYQTEFDPQILAGMTLKSVRGCEYPPPGSVVLDGEQRHASSDELGPGMVFDGRIGGAKLRGAPWDLDLSNDGSLVVVGLSNKTDAIQVFRTGDGSEVELKVPKGHCRGVVFSADSKRVLAVLDEYKDRLWSIPLSGADPRELAEVPRTTGLVRHRDGSAIAVLGPRLEVLSPKGKPIATLHYRGTDECLNMTGCFAPEGPQLFVYGLEKSRIMQVDYVKNTDHGGWDGPYERPGIVDVRGGRLLVMANNSYGGFVFDVASGARLLAHRFKAEERLGGVALSMDGSLLVEMNSRRFTGYRLPAAERGVKGPDSTAGGRLFLGSSAFEAPMVAFTSANHRLAEHRVQWAPLVGQRPPPSSQLQ